MGYVFAILSGLAAGTSVVTGKMGILRLSTEWYLFYLSFFSAVFSTLYLGLGRKESIPKLPPRVWFFFLAHTLSSYFAMLTFWLGTRSLNPAVADFLVRGETVVIVFLSVAFLRERLVGFEILGAFLILAGVFFMSRSHSEGSVQTSGVFFVLASAFFFGTTELFSKMVAAQIPTSQMVLLRNYLLLLLFAVTAFLLKPFEMPTPGEAAIVSLSALTGPFLARLFFMLALKRVPLSKAALFGQVEPFFTALLSLIIFQEALLASQWAGGILILAGASFIIRYEATAEKTAVPK